jgi:homoserine O-succinyltransferase
MPLMINGGRIPAHWAEKTGWRRARSVDNNGARTESIKIALVNNMPDAALEDTESQFFELLEAAAGDLPVHIQLYSLPNLPRSERGLQHLSNFYSGMKHLFDNYYEGVIITGTEPRQADLRNEPYWRALTELFDWAEENTLSTILSCLAAHAAVLHSDDIPRYRLADKRFGVFKQSKLCDHALTSHTPGLIQIPHSRWNELREDELAACGYLPLTKSSEAGVDLFVKQKKDSLCVHFQGHPEYAAETLFKEYRRDVKRFLRQERDTYPSMPLGYFDAVATEHLIQFRELALSQPHEDLMHAFPDGVAIGALVNTWRSSAIRVYQNWLHYIATKKTKTSAVAATGSVGRGLGTWNNQSL